MNRWGNYSETTQEKGWVFSSWESKCSVDDAPQCILAGGKWSTADETWQEATFEERVDENNLLTEIRFAAKRNFHHAN